MEQCIVIQTISGGSYTTFYIIQTLTISGTLPGDQAAYCILASFIGDDNLFTDLFIGKK